MKAMVKQEGKYGSVQWGVLWIGGGKKEKTSKLTSTAEIKRVTGPTREATKGKVAP